MYDLNKSKQGNGVLGNVGLLHPEILHNQVLHASKQASFDQRFQKSK